MNITVVKTWLKANTDFGSRCKVIKTNPYIEIVCVKAVGGVKINFLNHICAHNVDLLN